MRRQSDLIGPEPGVFHGDSIGDDRGQNEKQGNDGFVLMLLQIHANPDRRGENQQGEKDNFQQLPVKIKHCFCSIPPERRADEPGSLPCRARC
ncbi:MAG: hypothetical protein ACOC0K_02380 [bacterium]